MLKKIICMLLMLLTAAFPLAQKVSAQGVSVSAKSAVLINADNGEVLFAKNESERLPMASTTKIMTSLITLETAAVENKKVKITDEMVRVEGSSMGLLPGYQLTLRDLAVGMLTVSGNDAANSAAIAISGSTEEFAKLMNQRAQELDMKNTHFVTPSGLDSEEHYSTAYDMSLLGAAAMKNPDFAAIAGQKQAKVHFLEPEQTFHFSNHNRLLSLYEGCNGIKTGFTKKSGRCLVSSAERDGVRLVAVTLNAPDDWNDHIALFNYGFSQLAVYPIDDTAQKYTAPVVGGLADSVPLSCGSVEPPVLKTGEDARVARTVKLPKFLYAPVKAGQTVGEIEYTLDGVLLAAVPITADSDVGCPELPKSTGQKILEWFQNLFR